MPQLCHPKMAQLNVSWCWWCSRTSAQPFPPRCLCPAMLLESPMWSDFVNQGDRNMKKRSKNRLNGPNPNEIQPAEIWS